MGERARARVRFEPHNLVLDSPARSGADDGRFDLVSCRNVLLYFGRDRVAEVCRRLAGALADDGRLVFIAFLRGPKTELDINELMRRRLTLTGSTLRPRPVEFKGAIADSLRGRVWPLIEAGRIRPVIYKTFALAEAGAAHALMESSQHIGKLVLTV